MTNMWSLKELRRRAGDTLRRLAYRHSWKIAGLLAVLIVAAAAVLLWPAPTEPVSIAPQTLSAEEIDTAQQRYVIVYVSGAVRYPGLYRLEAGLRVVDAIVSAGGILENADPSCLPNLAAHLKDAKQIDIPFAGRCKGASKKVRLNINTATREQLLTVPGIDPSLADAIITWRQANSGFQQLSELKSGLGMDTALYKQLEKSLTAP